MPVYLSPGVFPREIDVPTLPTGAGPIRPALIGTAKKGPLNKPVLITNAQRGIDIFGEPMPESYLMYEVLACLSETSECYVMRVGIEQEEGQPEELSDVAIDTSGGRGKGWGRVPLFTGIDYGRVNLRAVSDSNPVVFHNAAIVTTEYNDVDVSSTHGATSAVLETTGTYAGDSDDSYIMIITSAPGTSEDASVNGAGFQIVRNSDGEIVAEGYLSDDNFDGVSDWISIEDGLSVRVNVSSGVLDTNDTFALLVQPNNRSFSISVEGDTANVYQMPVASYNSVSDFVDAFNDVISGSEDYLMVEYTLDDGSTIPQLRTTTAGERIQIVTTNAWALEVGSQQYAWDIPRSYILGLDPGPYNITTQNNRVKINVIGQNQTKTTEFSVPVGLNQTSAMMANAIDVAGVVVGDTLWDSFELTVPGGDTHVVIVASSAHQFDTLQVLASFSNLKTLRFVEELNIQYPYKRAYRGYNDNRLVLPDSGQVTASVPLSCESDPSGSDCAADTAYFQNIVGWLVATSPGTWIDNYTVTLELFTDGLGDVAGRYKLTILDANKQVVDVVDDISFDKRDERYIGNVINPGTKYGGSNGNVFINWDERPAFLDNDVNGSFVVRLPSQLSNKEFNGQANGIPYDPAYSSELDSVVIGNPSTSSGLYAFQNPEAIDINILLTPGFSTGAVIGTALQICEGRGDTIYLVDPPFGLRPEQVVDWHNGMLYSDLSSAINSSYGALYHSWVRVYDQFNSTEIWIPPSGHVASIYGRTAREAEQWYAPAGLRRGRLLQVLDVEYSASLGERNLMYGSNNAVNALVNFPQEGVVVWGQKTLLRTSSVLNRVSVRMLSNYVKTNLVELLRNFIYEPNDRVLWRQVKATIDPFLSGIQSRRGFTAFNTVVDETNNTPERVDRGELWVSIFMKPTPTAEFVALNMVFLRTGASFAAEEVLAAGGIVSTATATG